MSELSPDEANALTWALGPPFDGVPARTVTGGRLNRDRRWRLLPALHAVNDRVGWISPAAIDGIARRLGLTATEVYAVASFYDLFSLDPQPTRQVHACVDLACRAANPHLAASVPDGVHRSSCLGLCERAPAALVTQAGTNHQAWAVGAVTSDDLTDLLAGRRTPEQVPPEDVIGTSASDANPILLKHRPDLDSFLEAGGFDALATARQIGSQAIIDAVTAAGLTGRGGAGFPTGRKWAAVRDQRASPHYLVCNADESEPGTFKDRALIENDPFGLIESVAIAMIAIGAETAYIYLRGEYPAAWNTLAAALDAVRLDHRTAAVLTGMDIVMFKGAGAYVCGEETAIFNSIEGHRGEPRNKPPFPFEVGLFGKPTAVNNVETLMNLPAIIHSIGDDSYRANRRLFCVSGAVASPGVYEADLGLTLRDLIERAGGVRSGSEVQAVLLGGAAGAFVGPDQLDLVLDHESVTAAGLSLGSGVVMVLDTTVDLGDQVLRIAKFFSDESCGQCVPCRVGTVRQLEALQRLADPDGQTTTARDVDLGVLREIGQVMTDASICGLGQTAASAVLSALDTLGVFDE